MPDIPAGPTTTTTIAVGETIEDVLEVRGDHDWIRIELTAGEQVIIRLGGTGADPVGDTYLYVRDSSGNLIAQDDDGGPGLDSRLLFRAETAGTYYIDVGAYANWYTGTYSLSVVEAPPDIPAGPETTTTITVGETIQDVLEVSGDHDWIRLELTEGQGVLIRLDDAGTDLSLRDADGNLVADGRYDGSSGQQLLFLADAAGTFYIDVAGYPWATGTYSLSVEQVQIVDSAGTVDSVYGSNNTADTAAYDPASNPDLLYAISDGGGIDTFDFSMFDADQTINLRSTGDFGGGASSVGGGIDNLMIYSGTVIENAIGGSGNDHITGNSSDNFLIGGAGDDYLFDSDGDDHLDGGTGADVMLGDDGNDTYYVDDPGDRVVEYIIFSSTGRYTDTVYSSINYALTSNVENLILTGSAVRGRGNDIANTITGTSAANVLDGRQGADLLIGGDGDDLYIVDNSGDEIVETASGGRDTVYSTVNHTLASHVEVLFLRGNVAIRGTGNELANKLVGNSRDNLLDGGAGADAMYGGLGNDTYYVDDLGDRVIERPGEGIDLVYSSISYSLSPDVENLTLAGLAIRGNGNSLVNRITGNSENNILNGGAGGDVMRGRAGDDSYYVDHFRDQVLEDAGEGADTVHSSISYALSSNVENLELRGTAIRATGNLLDNELRGTSGNNVLDGRGGADTMRGGRGDDIYFVDNSGDRVVEASGAGEDRVYSTVTYRAEANVENVFLRGSSAIDASGNRLDNVLVGNNAANALAGGRGADDLRGAGGADTFVFRDGDFAGLSPSTSDRIIDFSSAEGDRISLDLVDANSSAAGRQNFAFIGTGAFTGTAGELRYQQINGNTYVYGDTNGDGAADFMIRLDGNYSLAPGDFVI